MDTARSYRIYLLQYKTVLNYGMWLNVTVLFGPPKFFSYVHPCSDSCALKNASLMNRAVSTAQSVLRKKRKAETAERGGRGCARCRRARQRAEGRLPVGQVLRYVHQCQLGDSALRWHLSTSLLASTGAKRGSEETDGETYGSITSTPHVFLSAVSAGCDGLMATSSKAFSCPSRSASTVVLY